MAGPNDDGTLNNRDGQPVANTGHDYRLKNLFGWDLRGTEGVYGPDYQNKSYVRATNLLTDTRTPAELVAGDARWQDGKPTRREARQTLRCSRSSSFEIEPSPLVSMALV